MDRLVNALPFYRYQNVLGWSKFFVPDRKFIYILWQSQTIWARQKDDLHSVKLVFVPAQKFLKKHSLMPCPFTGPKMFCAGPNFLTQPKNLTEFSASSKTFAGTKTNFTECESSFCQTQNVCDCHNM